VLVSEVNHTNYYTKLIRQFYDDFEQVLETYDKRSSLKKKKKKKKQEEVMMMMMMMMFCIYLWL